MAKRNNNQKLATQQSVDQVVKSIRDIMRRGRGPDARLHALGGLRRSVVDTRTPEELVQIIEAKGREIAEALETILGKPELSPRS